MFIIHDLLAVPMTYALVADKREKFIAGFPWPGLYRQVTKTPAYDYDPTRGITIRSSFFILRVV